MHDVDVGRVLRGAAEEASRTRPTHRRHRPPRPEHALSLSASPLLSHLGYHTLSLRSIPKGFDEELRFLSRELLRAWPEAAAGGAAEDSTAWTMRFAEDYFVNGGREGLLARRRAESAAAGDDAAEEEEPIAFPTPEELEAKIQQIFVAADADGNGVLDRKEFKRVMKLFASELKLQVADLRQIMMLADENDDGLIEYHEFVPVALELLQTMYAKMRHAQQQAKRQSRAADAAQDFLLNGLTRAQLEAALSEMFRAADTDGSGALDRKECVGARRARRARFARERANRARACARARPARPRRARLVLTHPARARCCCSLAPAPSFRPPPPLPPRAGSRRASRRATWALRRSRSRSCWTRWTATTTASCSTPSSCPSPLAC